jgi:hypothetical protein
MLGGVAEWLKAPVLKTGRDESPSWVRIPPPPFLSLRNREVYILTLSKMERLKEADE